MNEQAKDKLKTPLDEAAIEYAKEADFDQSDAYWGFINGAEWQKTHGEESPVVPKEQFEMPPIHLSDRKYYPQEQFEEVLEALEGIVDAKPKNIHEWVDYSEWGSYMQSLAKSILEKYKQSK